MVISRKLDKLFKLKLSDTFAISESKSKSKRTSSFVPPTVNEVRDYSRERSNAVHAEEFVDFYASNGWIFWGYNIFVCNG